MIQRLVDWNLEIAHVSWASPEVSGSIEEAMATAQEYLDDWARHTKKVVVCSLIDDKEMRISDRHVWLQEARQDYPRLFSLLDYVCFESDLVKLKGEFLEQLQPRQRGRIDREIERYRKKHGNVACSHDIAVWHLLRLGLLRSGSKILFDVRKNSGLAGRPFFAKSTLSILEEEDRAPEERAKEILRMCSENDIVDRIEVVYYA